MTAMKRTLTILLACALIIALSAQAIAETHTVYVARDGASVYDITGAVIGTADADTKLTLTGVKGNICQVKLGDKTAYMKKADLTTSLAAPEATQAPAEDDFTETSLTVYAARDGAKVYNAAGSAIGSVPVNTVLTCTGVKGNVCRVTRDGHTGYMKKADLSKAKVETIETVNQTAYAAENGTKVYDADGTVIGILDVNTQVTITAVKGSACRVTVNGHTGYMRASDLSSNKVATTSEAHTLSYGDTGEAVKRVQTRLKELGYFTGSIGGNYKTLTQSAVAAFQTQAKLTATGECDAKTLELLFSDSAPAMSRTADTGAASSTVTAARGTAKEMDWWTSDIQTIFARGTIATITDVETGLAWREQRRGGTNHADCQPLTAADTAVMKRVYGGTWSWNRRAIFVTIDGVSYAASMNGMPHGGGSIRDNNFDGHHCIHFTNSRTHGSNSICSQHQAAIKKALAARL